MSKNQIPTAGKPATTFANLRNKMEKQNADKLKAQAKKLRKGRIDAASGVASYCRRIADCRYRRRMAYCTCNSVAGQIAW